MKAWLARVLGSLVIVGSAMQAVAQEDAVPSPQSAIEVASNSARIDPANVPNNLLAIATLLINPKDRYKPVPLYGYQSLRGLDQEILKKALSAAAEGEAHVAIVELGGNGYRGRGVRISREAESAAILKDVQTALGAHEQQTTNKSMVAFTRPLRDQPLTKKFITTPGLWAEFRMQAARLAGNKDGSRVR